MTSTLVSNAVSAGGDHTPAGGNRLFRYGRSNVESKRVARSMRNDDINVPERSSRAMIPVAHELVSQTSKLVTRAARFAAMRPWVGGARSSVGNDRSHSVALRVTQPVRVVSSMITVRASTGFSGSLERYHSFHPMRPDQWEISPPVSRDEWCSLIRSLKQTRACGRSSFRRWQWGQASSRIGSMPTTTRVSEGAHFVPAACRQGYAVSSSQRSEWASRLTRPVRHRLTGSLR